MKVTNGKDVARLLVDEYLNCHPTGHKKFMESMAKEQQEIKDNYTYLGFAWLKGLSEGQILRSSKRSIETDGR